MVETTWRGPSPLSRREFLFYIWGASMAVAVSGTAGAILWYSYPRFRQGEFGGAFNLPVEAIPATTARPAEYAQGRFWLVNTSAGILALYKVCTHLGCLYKWADATGRFECPCHSSKYTRDGHWIEGPAPRNLDRFVVRAVDAEGSVLAATTEGDANSEPAAGAPLTVPPGTVQIVVDTGKRVKGALRGSDA